MVEAQTCNACAGRFLDDVSRVGFTADANLEDGRVDALLHACVEGEKCQVAEVGGFEFRVVALCCRGGFQAVPDLEEVLREEGLGEGRTIDLDTFADGAEVRGGVHCSFGDWGGGEETVLG